MAAGRKSHHADVLRAQAEFSGAGADQPQGTLCIPELNRMMIFRTDSVLQDKRSDPICVEPIGNLPPFVVHRDERIAAPRGNDDGCSAGIYRRIIRKRWLIDVRVSQCSGGAIWPNWKSLRFGNNGLFERRWRLNFGLLRQKSGFARENHCQYPKEFHRIVSCRNSNTVL